MSHGVVTQIYQEFRNLSLVSAFSGDGNPHHQFCCMPPCYLWRSTHWEGSGKIWVRCSYSMIFCPLFFPPPLLLKDVSTVYSVQTQYWSLSYKHPRSWVPYLCSVRTSLLPKRPCAVPFKCSGLVSAHCHVSFSSHCHYTSQILILRNQISP